MEFMDQMQTMVVEGASKRHNPFGKAIHALAKLHILRRVDELAAFNVHGIAPVRVAVLACDTSRMSKVKWPKTLQNEAYEQGIGFNLVVGRTAQRTHHQEQHLRTNTDTQKLFFSCWLRAKVQSVVKPF